MSCKKGYREEKERKKENTILFGKEIIKNGKGEGKTKGKRHDYKEERRRGV